MPWRGRVAKAQLVGTREWLNAWLFHARGIVFTLVALRFALLAQRARPRRRGPPLPYARSGAVVQAGGEGNATFEYAPEAPLVNQEPLDDLVDLLGMRAEDESSSGCGRDGRCSEWR